MITLVMGSAQQAGGDSLALQASPVVPAGDVTLRAVATLARAPGQEVAVWTLDGDRAGVSTWTLVRRRADGLSVWQTAITVALSEGPHVVTVALRSMTDGASVDAIPLGGGQPLEYRLKLSNQQNFNPQTIPLAGSAVSVFLDSVSIRGSGSGTVVAGVISLGETFARTPAWMVSTGLTPTATQFGVWAAGSSLFMRFSGCPAGTIDITAEIGSPIQTLGPVTITVT